MIVAAYDVGTTAVKGVLIGEGGSVLGTASQDITTIFRDNLKEQEPEEWWRAFCRISLEFAEISPGAKIDGIIMSGQMQDVIPVTREGDAAGNAILYSDGRANGQAEALYEIVGREYLESVTGNDYNGSLPLPKMMWLKENRPDIFYKTKYFLISAKDYIIFKLTGKAIGDVTACSTAGAMDIRLNKWDKKILDAAGIDIGMMPKLYAPHQTAGVLTAYGASATGLEEGTKVYVGMGDAGAATLASGISHPGEYNINLGTSGWVATVSSEVSQNSGGIFNLSAFENGLYINVVPFLNAGNVHKWISGLFTKRNEEDDIDYDYVNKELEMSEAGSRGITFLPYLNGERFPVMDSEVKGTFLGIAANTRRGDMIRSCLEGVAFSVRQGIESMDAAPEKISVIGGGARVEAWNQILADVLHQRIYVYKNSDILPALALNASVLLAEGKIKGYSDFVDSLQGDEYSVVYEPKEENMALYDKLYKKYLGIYPRVKSYYQE